MILLFAFAVRDVLLLRILFVAGSFAALGFYFYQSPPLWSAIGWTGVYIGIHTYWIVRICFERRPVILTPEEEKLFKLTFSKIDRRKFLTLVSIGRWKDGETGQYFFRHGEKVLQMSVLISGKVSVSVDGKHLVELLPGQVVGAGAVIAGVAPCDAIISESCRYITWDVANVDALRARDREFDSQFSDMVNKDLTAKLHQVVLKKTRNMKA